MTPREIKQLDLQFSLNYGVISLLLLVNLRLYHDNMKKWFAFPQRMSAGWPHRQGPRQLPATN